MVVIWIKSVPSVELEVLQEELDGRLECTLLPSGLEISPRTANPCEQPAKYSRLYSSVLVTNGIGLSLSVGGEYPVDLARVNDEKPR
jgi:hypothetical protein